MTALSIPVVIMAAVAFYVGLYHLYIYCRRPKERQDLTFALTCLAVGVYDVLCAGLYNVPTPEKGVWWQRRQLITLAFLDIAFLWFVVDYTRQQSKKLVYVFTGIFLVFAVLGMVDQSGLCWTDQPLVKNFQLPFGIDVTYYEMAFGPAMDLEAYMLILSYFYMLWVGVRYFQKGDRKRAIPLIVAVVLFLAGVAEDTAVATGVYAFIYTIEYAYIGMVLLMAYSLSNELVQATIIKEALKDSEERFRAIFEQAAVGVSQINTTTGQFIRVNQRFCDIFGCAKDDMTATTFMEITHPDDLQKDLDNREKLKAGHVREFSMEKRYFHKDGSVVWGHLCVSPMWAAGQKPNYHIAVVEDITDRKRAEKSLARQTELLNTILSTIPYSVFWKNRESVYQGCNKVFAEVVGIGNPENIIGKTDYDLPWNNKEADFYRQCDRQVVDTGIPVLDIEEPYTTIDGKKKTAITSKVPLKNQDGNVLGIIGVYYDITERKQMEEAIRQTQKMESIGTLVGGIAHEFNNILGGILGYAEIAKDDAPETSPVRESLDEIFKLGMRARDVVRQILFFSRKGNPEKKPIQLPFLIKEELKILRATIPSTVEISHNIDNTSGAVLADQTQFQQVVMNLCINAAHAMEGKGGVLEIGLCSTVLDFEGAKQFPYLKPGDYVKLTVSDTGTGIDPKTVDKIFDPFFTTKGVGKGTGMGLSVVHGIVQDHGGSITVESTVGKGTTFTILLPKAEGPEEEKRKEEQLPTGTENILLVDDEDFMVFPRKKTLEKMGYTVTAMTSSLETLELFKKDPQRYDLIITDLTMPHLTGDRLASEAIAIRPDMPVILATGYADALDSEIIKQSGIKAFIHKPCKKQDLAKTIRLILDGE